MGPESEHWIDADFKRYIYIYDTILYYTYIKEYNIYNYAFNYNR